MKKFLFFLLTVFTSINAYSQFDAGEISADEFLKETQKMDQGDSEISMVWWIPLEFWEISMAKDKTMSDFQKEALVTALEPYTIFAIVQGDIGAFGSVSYDSYDSIFNSITLKDKTGKKHRPLQMDELNQETEMLLTIMKPMLKNMMGDLGQNMNFYVFNDHDVNGRIFDPAKNGVAEIKFLDKIEEFNLPLTILLPKKECPKDKKQMSGSWKYCPWHGVELVPVKE